MSGFEELARILGCEIGNFHTVYLGLPLGARSLPVPIWEKLLETVAKRLIGWKTMCLSIGRRTTYLKQP